MAASTSKKKPAASKPAAAAKDPGFITVRVGKLPGRIGDIALNGGRKVRDALSGAELSDSGYEIKVNACPATLDTNLKQGDTVLLVRKVKGNAA